MRRTHSLDHEFDKKLFADLLKTALGSRSQTEFAKDAGVSVAYLCKYINQNFDAPPTPSTLKKLANASANGVRYKELLLYAGYDPDKFDDIVSTASIVPDNSKAFFATIISSLNTLSIRWNIDKQEERKFSKLSISLPEYPITTWLFTYHPAACFEPLTPDKFTEIIFYYGSSTAALNENNKISYVTDSETMYLTLKSFPSSNIPCLASIILIDPATLNVIKEEYIAHQEIADSQLLAQLLLK